MARDYLGSIDRMCRRIHGQHPEMSGREVRDWAVRIAERNSAEKREGRHAPVSAQAADICETSEAARELREEFGMEVKERTRAVQVQGGDIHPVAGTEQE